MENKDLKTVLLESYIIQENFETVLDDTYPWYMEGFNMDTILGTASARKKYKNALKSAKAKLKSGDRRGAIQDLDKAEDYIKKVKEGISDVNEGNDYTTMIVGNILSAVITLGRTLLMSIIPIANIVGIPASAYINIKRTLQKISTQLNTIKDPNKEVSPKFYNSLANTAIGMCDDYIREIEKVKRSCRSK